MTMPRCLEGHASMVRESHMSREDGRRTLGRRTPRGGAREPQQDLRRWSAAAGNRRSTSVISGTAFVLCIAATLLLQTPIRADAVGVGRRAGVRRRSAQMLRSHLGGDGAAVVAASAQQVVASGLASTDAANRPLQTEGIDGLASTEKWTTVTTSRAGSNVLIPEGQTREEAVVEHQEFLGSQPGYEVPTTQFQAPYKPAKSHPRGAFVGSNYTEWYSPQMKTDGAEPEPFRPPLIPAGTFEARAKRQAHHDALLLASKLRSERMQRRSHICTLCDNAIATGRIIVQNELSGKGAGQTHGLASLVDLVCTTITHSYGQEVPNLDCARTVAAVRKFYDPRFEGDVAMSHKIVERAGVQYAVQQDPKRVNFGLAAALQSCHTLLGIRFCDVGEGPPAKQVAPVNPCGCPAPEPTCSCNNGGAAPQPVSMEPKPVPKPVPVKMPKEEPQPCDCDCCGQPACACPAPQATPPPASVPVSVPAPPAPTPTPVDEEDTPVQDDETETPAESSEGAKRQAIEEEVTLQGVTAADFDDDKKTAFSRLVATVASVDDQDVEILSVEDVSAEAFRRRRLLGDDVPSVRVTLKVSFDKPENEPGIRHRLGSLCKGGRIVHAAKMVWSKVTSATCHTLGAGPIPIPAQKKQSEDSEDEPLGDADEPGTTGKALEEEDAPLSDDESKDGDEEDSKDSKSKEDDDVAEAEPKNEDEQEEAEDADSDSDSEEEELDAAVEKVKAKREKDSDKSKDKMTDEDKESKNKSDAEEEEEEDADSDAEEEELDAAVEKVKREEKAKDAKSKDADADESEDADDDATADADESKDTDADEPKDKEAKAGADTDANEPEDKSKPAASTRSKDAKKSGRKNAGKAKKGKDSGSKVDAEKKDKPDKQESETKAPKNATAESPVTEDSGEVEDVESEEDAAEDAEEDGQEEEGNDEIEVDDSDDDDNDDKADESEEEKQASKEDLASNGVGDTPSEDSEPRTTEEIIQLKNDIQELQQSIDERKQLANNASTAAANNVNVTELEGDVERLQSLQKSLNALESQMQKIQDSSTDEDEGEPSNEEEEAATEESVAAAGDAAAQEDPEASPASAEAANTASEAENQAGAAEAAADDANGQAQNQADAAAEQAEDAAKQAGEAAETAAAAQEDAADEAASKAKLAQSARFKQKQQQQQSSTLPGADLPATASGDISIDDARSFFLRKGELPPPQPLM